MGLPRPNFESDESILIVLGLIGGIAAALTALAVYVFILPATVTKTTTLASYEQSGSYRYTVTAEPSALNPSGVIGPISPDADTDGTQAPQPIFTRLARTLDFSYVYQLQGATDASGTISAALVIKAGEDWTNSMSLVPPTPFQGATGAIEGSVDFAAVSALLAQVEEQTGVRASSVDLSINPVVNVEANSNGQQIQETYSSPLTFAYTPTLITPGDTLSFSEPKTITSSVTNDKELGLFGSTILVTSLRPILGILALITLVLTGYLAVVYFLGVGRSEARMVRTRYRSLIVPIEDVQSAVNHRIAVASVHDLAQMAKREGRSLFVRDFTNGSEVYLVHDGMVVYYYTLGDVPDDWMKTTAAPVVAPAVVAAPAAISVANGAAAQAPASRPEPETLAAEPPHRKEQAEALPHYLTMPHEPAPGNGSVTASEEANGHAVKLHNLLPPLPTESELESAPDDTGGAPGEETGLVELVASAAASLPLDSAAVVETEGLEGEPEFPAATEATEDQAVAMPEPARAVSNWEPEVVSNSISEPAASEMAPATSASISPPQYVAASVGHQHAAPQRSVRRWLRKRSGGPLSDTDRIEERLRRGLNKPFVPLESFGSDEDDDFGPVTDARDEETQPNSEPAFVAEEHGVEVAGVGAGQDPDNELDREFSDDRPEDSETAEQPIEALDSPPAYLVQITSEHAEVDDSPANGSLQPDETSESSLDAVLPEMENKMDEVEAEVAIPTSDIASPSEDGEATSAPNPTTASVPSARRPARNVPLERKVTNYARRWLRNFLEYSPDENSDNR
jgi:Family of unknown function (DUF5305)